MTISFYLDSQRSCRAVRRCMSAVMVVLALLSLPVWAEDPDMAKLRDQQARELSVLAMTVKHFKVDKVSPVDALKTLWETALGHKATDLTFELDETESQNRGNIAPVTLDLEDVPVRTIVGYIAELSGSRWYFRGTSSLNLKLVIEPIVTAICRPPVCVEILPINSAAAELLQLQPGQSMEQVMNVLAGFGVQFSKENYDLAAYDAKMGTLTVVAASSEASLAVSLVRLANNGMKIEKPAKKNE